jgi:outer membrane protein assembly factor BamA
MRLMRIGMLVVAAMCLTQRAQSQAAEKPAATGWEFVGLPALNYTTDEGFGYGLLAQIYNYGAGVKPYRYTIQPTVFLTTKGRRDVVVFFDAPNLLPRAWRLDVWAGREQQLANPYYGRVNANATVYDSTNEAAPNSFYYRYGNVQFRVASNLQHQLGSSAARVLFGVGFGHATTDDTPYDSGTTLLATELAGAPAPEGNVNFVRAGLVWDTRNREIGASRGTYADLIVQRVDEILGATTSYTRATATVRQYASLTPRLVAAGRVIVQQTSGTVPLYDAAMILASYKSAEGLGGTSSVRGLAKNRFVGKGLVMGNAELRWRFKDFTIRRKPMFLLASGFVDAGRVWDEGIKPGEIFTDLHAAFGGGLRIGLGQSFVIAVDYGKSKESSQLYIGLGYPF